MGNDAPVELYTDGASRGNPGAAAIGAWARRGDDVLFELSRGIGRRTNNEAEYLALIAGLERLLEIGCTQEPVRVLMDSELIVRQINGEYRVRSAGLRPFWKQVQTLIGNFDDIRFAHIPRAQNRRADELANAALDAQ